MNIPLANTLATSNRSDKLSAPIVTHDSLWLRKLAYLGARYGSPEFVRISPAIIGALLSGILVRHRRVIQENLRLIFGKRDPFSEQRDIARTFAQFGSCLAESLGSERIDPKKMRYRVQGDSVLNELVRECSGFIVLTAHVGAWDLAARHLQQELGRSVMIAMMREPNLAARQFHDSIRLRRGIEITHVGDHAFEGLPLLRHLRNGGVLAVQMDRIPKGSRSLDVQLFGQEFKVPMGPFRLASLANVPLVPVFCARTGHFEYEVNVHYPIWLRRRPSADQLQEAACKATCELERFLQRYPTQWFNFEPERVPSAKHRNRSSGADGT